MSRLNASYESFNAALSPAFLLADSEELRESLRQLAKSTLHLMNQIKEFGSTDGTERLLTEQRHVLRATEAAMRREFGLTANSANL